MGHGGDFAGPDPVGPVFPVPVVPRLRSGRGRHNREGGLEDYRQKVLRPLPAAAPEPAHAHHSRVEVAGRSGRAGRRPVGRKLGAKGVAELPTGSIPSVPGSLTPRC